MFDHHKPEDDNVQEMNHIPQPTNVRDLQCFLRKFTFMNKYFPILEELSPSLRELTMKNTPLALFPPADRRYWWLEINNRVLRMYSSDHCQLHPAAPILFYNIKGTVSMTPNHCIIIFCLVVNVSTFLDHFTFDIVEVIGWLSYVKFL